MNRQLVEWQLEDPATGCVFPWFVHGFLEVLKTWDLSETTVLEYGGGRSTAWWATKAQKVVTVEANEVFRDRIMEELIEKDLLRKAVLVFSPAIDDTTDPVRVKNYIDSPNGIIAHDIYDIVVVDGIMRHECTVKALEILGKTGGRLIVDNWQQDGFVCPASEELMSAYDGHLFVQEDHKDHHGRKWCTAYWEIPKVESI